MDANTVRIIAAVLDTKQLTLYKEDGETLTLEQGDHRIKPLLDAAVPVLDAGGVYEFELQPIEKENHYKEFEEKSSGLVKFFRVAKKLVKHIFHADEPAQPVAPMKAGRLPVTRAQNSAPTAADVVDAVEPVKMDTNTAVSEILKNATPVSDVNFKNLPKETDDTIIAVVGDKIIPNVEKVKSHIAHHSKLGSPQGMEKFFARLASVIDSRGHSVEDVLRFMERGDLPVADDGTIIAYKLLNKRDEGFVDVHSGNVKQRVGSIVQVDESLVDRNRRNECSNGLHVARRAYLGGFSGNSCVLIAVAPEDVVTVPHNDANKVRVCKYRILAQLSDSAMRNLKNNRAMTSDEEAQKLLARALRCDYGPAIERVEIHGSCGAGLKIINLDPDGNDVLLATPIFASKVPEPVDHDTKDAVAIEAPTDNGKVAPAAPVNPVAVAPAPKPVDKDIPEHRRLFNEKKFNDLDMYRRSKKRGYAALGFTKTEIKMIEAGLAPVKEVAKPAEKPTTASAIDSIQGKVQSNTAKATAAKPVSEMTRNEKAAYYLSIINVSNTTPAGREAYQDLLALKKKAKVSWSQLNIMDFDSIQAKFEK